MQLRFAPNVVLFVAATFCWLDASNYGNLLLWLCPISLIAATRHAFLEAKLPSLLTWFVVPYCGLFLFGPSLVAVAGFEPPASPEVYADYCFLAVAGIHLFLLGHEAAWTLKPAARAWQRTYGIRPTRLVTAIVVLFAVNAVALAGRVYQLGSPGALITSTRLVAKEATDNSLGQVSTYLFAAGAVLYPLVGVYLRWRRLNFPVLLSVLLVMEVFIFLALRTRTLLVIHAVGFTVGWFFLAPRIWFEGIQLPSRRIFLSTSQALCLGALAIALLVTGQVVRTMRGKLEVAQSLRDIDINVVESLQYDFQSGTINYSPVTCQILDLVPAQFDYLGGQSYYRLLFAFVPRSIWPDKPPNTQRILAQWLNPDRPDVQTAPAGVIGDLYVNFGIAGVLGMFVFGYACGCADRSDGLTAMIFLAVSFGMVFHFARGGFTNPMLNFAVYYATTRQVASYLVAGTLCGKAGATVPPYILPSVST